MENEKTPLKIEKEQAQVGDLVWVDGYSGFCQGDFEKIKSIETRYDTKTGEPYKVIKTSDGVYRYDNGQRIKGASAYSIFYYATYRNMESVSVSETKQNNITKFSNEIDNGKKKFVSWRRVSTKKQGKSGLGLEAQKDIIDYFVKAENGVIIADYVEVYTGKDLEGCKELQKAMAHCKEIGATLIIAKTDRFRNTIEALQTYDDMNGNIYFCDLPHTDKFTLTLFFALSEREALMVSIRTKAALKALKDRGVKLGAPTDANVRKANEYSRIAITNKAKENENNKEFKVFMEVFEEENNIILKRGIDQKYFDMLASKLNRHGKKTQKGLEWNKDRVYNIVKRIKERYR
jgi:DNA invertase Pin-like site-specific DNA recombinase